MRGTLTLGRRFPHHTRISPFSTSSSSGGRGRGSGGPTHFDFVGGRDTSAPGHPTPEPDPSPAAAGLGHGHGRGRAFPSAPVHPAFSSAGRGRAGLESRPIPEPHRPLDANLPAGVLSSLTSGGGAGRGKAAVKDGEAAAKEENRHARPRPSPSRSPNPNPSPITESRPKLSREEAVKRAVGILSRDGGGDGEAAEGGRGRGRGGGRGRGRGGWRRDREREEDAEDGLGEGALAATYEEMEEVGRAIGPETREMLIQGWKEITDRVLPSPMDDAVVDALHTNLLIECEPEYLMPDLSRNPDIDDNPPMPLPEVLDKVKPFIMAYEGLETNEQWQEAVDETMKNLPLLKEIVDHYSGPDTVTAKQQQQELERVANTIPQSAPPPVHRFAHRALLSLQSNPGWGFDKKCQFMDKLVREVANNPK
ncbi:hypothetical protein Tsubulata_000950 [Turnera subulata]|uniref:Uncharacterized protein n=1 Tax=Turnera subulata TaxID=218843 RepID=A0A9Q0JI04_9ROSI|nr:hypothetical protein Tsubulata_000950 [Turnera subulata]